MGTINYSTGDFITLAVRPFDPYIDDESSYDDYVTDMAEYIKAIIASYDIGMYMIKVKFEYGYYDGFCVTVNDDQWSYFDFAEERRDAQREITQLKRMLLELIDAGMVVCSPSWCTTYTDAEESRRLVKSAIARIREYINNVPTWYQYEHNLPTHRVKDARTINVNTEDAHITA